MAQHIEFKNILVIHFGQLGDVVLSLPALDAIRRRFNEARITLLVGTATEQVARLADVADDYITVDRVELRDGKKGRSIRKIFSVVSEIRQRRFDLVIDLHSLPETNLLGYLARIPQRLYANRESRSIDRLSNFRPRPETEDKSEHLTARYFDVLVPLDITPPTLPFAIRPRPDDLDAVRGKFPQLIASENGTLVGLFPGAGNPSRCWPLDKFAELSSALANADLTPIVFLGPEEKRLRAEIGNTFPSQAVVIEGLSIPQFIAAVSLLSVFVSNDTGPVHLASLASVPIVLILDKRAPATYLPNARDLSVVGGKLISEIEVASVFQAIRARMTNADAA